LPTLVPDDLDPRVMTDAPRYRALSNALRKQRRAPFQVRINGEDPLDLVATDVTTEGAATSLQLHLRVTANEFARTHNAVQLATAPALAFAGNSATFLGHRLWDETRIALFKHAVDARTEQDPLPRVARVSFGTGWVEQGAFELFEQSVGLHSPLLPVLGPEQDAGAVVSSGNTPELAELRLHHGTVWRWNRAVYDPSGGGHLRIELRFLPSGPTRVDMMANAAFVLGLALDLKDEADDWTRALPFQEAEHNFYRAAELGPDATFTWLSPTFEVIRVPARELVPSLVDRARRGLGKLGIRGALVMSRLDVFQQRAESGRTGARWQRRRLSEFGARFDPRESLSRMFAEYRARSSEECPVHLWTP
jgi:hypothetical protein